MKSGIFGLENVCRACTGKYFLNKETTVGSVVSLKHPSKRINEIGSIALLTEAGRNKNRGKYNAYGSSKTALNAFTVMLATDLRDNGICVNSVTPGYTAIGLNR